MMREALMEIPKYQAMTEGEIQEIAEALTEQVEQEMKALMTQNQSPLTAQNEAIRSVLLNLST